VATQLDIDAGPVHLAEDLRHWVNDGLMTLFFFVVGLEIKRELVDGRLSDRRDAALPAIAAVGGMVVPAAMYALLNAPTGSTPTGCSPPRRECSLCWCRDGSASPRADPRGTCARNGCL